MSTSLKGRCLVCKTTIELAKNKHKSQNISTYAKIDPIITQSIMFNHHNNIVVVFLSIAQCVLHMGNFVECGTMCRTSGR
jgi:hypothetical protein